MVLNGSIGSVSGDDYGCHCFHLFNIDRFILFLTPFHPARGGRQNYRSYNLLLFTLLFSLFIEKPSYPLEDRRQPKGINICLCPLVAEFFGTKNNKPAPAFRRRSAWVRFPQFPKSTYSIRRTKNGKEKMHQAHSAVKRLVLADELVHAD